MPCAPSPPHTHPPTLSLLHPRLCQLATSAGWGQIVTPLFSAPAAPLARHSPPRVTAYAYNVQLKRSDRQSSMDSRSRFPLRLLLTRRLLAIKRLDQYYSMPLSHENPLAAPAVLRPPDMQLPRVPNMQGWPSCDQDPSHHARPATPTPPEPPPAPAASVAAPQRPPSLLPIPPPPIPRQKPRAGSPALRCRQHARRRCSPAPAAPAPAAAAPWGPTRWPCPRRTSHSARAQRCRWRSAARARATYWTQGEG